MHKNSRQCHSSGYVGKHYFFKLFLPLGMQL
jgi:hypothetical protein